VEIVLLMIGFSVVGQAGSEGFWSDDVIVDEVVQL